MFDLSLFQIGEPTAFEGVRVLRSGKPGPRVGLMGMLHGNEPAGIGLWQLANDLGPPLCGELYLIIGHPEAFRRDRGVRFIKDDINRMFLDDAALTAKGIDRSGPDYRRLIELKAVIAELDHLIDIHSTSAPSAPFAIILAEGEPDVRPSEELPLTTVQGLERYIVGTATEWAVRQRARTGITVEVGCHSDPAGAGRAYDVALDLLHQLGMAGASRGLRSPVSMLPAPHQVTICGHVQHVGTSFTYRRHYQNFDRLKPGEIIGQDDRRVYRAPRSLSQPIIVMPAAEATLQNGSNTDAFFFGIETMRPQAGSSSLFAQSA